MVIVVMSLRKENNVKRRAWERKTFRTYRMAWTSGRHVSDIGVPSGEGNKTGFHSDDILNVRFKGPRIADLGKTRDKHWNQCRALVASRLSS